MTKKLVENIIIRCANIAKENTAESISNYVNFLVRTNERANYYGSISTAIDEISDLNPVLANTSFVKWDKKDVTIMTYFKNDAIAIADFFSTIETIFEIDKKLSEIPVTEVDFNTLNITDKAFLTLLAHQNYNKVNVLLDSEKANTELKKAVLKYYADGTLSDAKKYTRNAFHKVCGAEGKLFYGLKLKNSDMPDDIMRYFLASFGKDPKFQIVTRNKIKCNDGYKYSNTCGKKKTQEKSLSDLFAVLVDSMQKSTSALAEVVKIEDGSIVIKDKVELKVTAPDENGKAGLTVKK